MPRHACRRLALEPHRWIEHDVAFAIAFAAAGCAGLASSYFLARAPEPPMAPGAGPAAVFAALRAPFRDPVFVRVLIFLAAWDVASNLAGIDGHRAVRLVLLYVLHVEMGIASGGIGLAIGNLGLKLAPQGAGTPYLAVQGLVSALAGGVAPLVAGAVAQWFAPRDFSIVLRWVSPARTARSRCSSSPTGASCSRSRRCSACTCCTRCHASPKAPRSASGR
ncbi:MAG: hypothetical protein JO090_01095 [Rhizobacter sp.]|nr:hypothetical protein [Rhizobacter sp.]